jgi:P pilus assembly chaperone PapD
MKATMHRSILDTSKRTFFVGALALVVATTASASVTMSATRYIYPSAAKEITSKVSNVGKLPALTQVWIDDGDEKSTPETVDVPFNVTPPISRIEAGKSQTVRISYTGGALPDDRESPFWLNVLEVPPMPEEGSDQSKMQLAFRYRLKLFYRPKGLAGSSDAAANGLAWSATGSGLKVVNDSAFHVTVNDLKVEVDGRVVEMEPFAVNPRSSSVLQASEALPGDRPMTVRFQTINDYGGFVPHSTTLSP